LNNGRLQLKVLEGEPTNLEQALSFATKHEAYKSSLVSQGTLSKTSAGMSVSDDDDRPRRRSHAVSAVQDTGKDSAPPLSADEVRDLLAQATKGIAALAAQSSEADKDKSGAKSFSSKKNSGARNSGRGGGRRYSGKRQDPKVDLCHNCNEVGHWARDCPKPKQPPKEQVQASSVSCQLVSLTRIYVTAYVDGRPIQCLLDSGYERSVISRNIIPNAKLTRS